MKPIPVFKTNVGVSELKWKQFLLELESNK